MLGDLLPFMLPAGTGCRATVSNLELKRCDIFFDRQLAAANVLRHTAGEIIGFADVHDHAIGVSDPILARFGRRFSSIANGWAVLGWTPGLIDTHCQHTSFAILQQDSIVLQNLRDHFQSSYDDFEKHIKHPLSSLF